MCAFYQKDTSSELQKSDRAVLRILLLGIVTVLVTTNCRSETEAAAISLILRTAMRNTRQ